MMLEKLSYLKVAESQSGHTVASNVTTM